MTLIKKIIETAVMAFEQKNYFRIMIQEVRGIEPFHFLTFKKLLLLLRFG